MRRAAILLVATVLLTAARTMAAMAPDDQLHLADGLYTRGIYDMAVREYLLLLENAPEHPAADAVYFCIADSYRNMSNLVAALRYYAETEKRFPKSVYRFRAAIKRADLLDEDRKSAEAVAVLRQTVADRPPDEIAASALYKLGGILARTGNPAEAQTAYEQLVAGYGRTPYYPYTLLTLGGLYAAAPGGVTRALGTYRIAATNESTPRINAEAWFQLGDLLNRERQYPASAEAFAKLAELYPNDVRTAEARLPWAWSLFYAGMAAEALKHSADALELPAVTGNPAAHEEWLYLKANCQRQIIDHFSAAGTYSNLLTRFPRGHYVQAAGYERAMALHKAGMFREAVAQLRLLKADVAHLADVYWLLAESHSALKEEGEAIQYYKLINEQYPESPLAVEAGYRLARILQKRGEFLPAAELFGSLASKNPGHALAPQALFAGAVCLSKGGRHEEAVRDWGVLIQKYPQNALIEDTLFQKGMSEIFLHRDTQAIETMRELLAKFTATRHAAETRFWLGMLLDGAGRSRDAEPELRQALKLQPDPELERRIRFQLALVLQRTGVHAEAAALLQNLLDTPMRERMPPALVEWLAEYHLDNDNPGAAAAAGVILTDTGTSNAWRQVGFCIVGKALQAQKKPVEAASAFSEAVAIEGNSEARAESACRLGDMALITNGLAQARAHFEMAANMASDDSLIAMRVRAYAGIGKALKAQGDREGAVKYFMSVAVLFDDPELVPECLGEAAELFRQLGRVEESDKAWQELAQRYPASKRNKQRPK